MQRLLIFSFLSILLIGLLMALLARKLQRSITLPIAIMAERFKEKLPQFTANEKMELSRSEIIEIRDILKSFLTTYERIEDYQKQEVKDAALRSVALLAQQVAHDIRSPLAALSSADKGLSELPEDSRLLIRSAVSRIKDIANQLISKTKWELKITGQQEDTAAVEASSPQFVALLVESIVSEKRLEFSERKEIAIETQLSDDAINLFILVDSIEFLRVLSNLINNGVDALTAAGRVSISVKENGSWVDIEIADNGKGIPVNVLNGLMVRGVTHGKSDGLGLGLYNARQCSEKWGGSLSIRSEIGKGTSINLKLPKATKPKWHLDTILIRPNATVVIVDDDPSIHEIWKSKLRRLRLKQTSCNELHFYTVEEFFNWYGNNKDVIKDKLFLIDYDFGGASMTGLEVIKKLNIYESSILVTSRFDQKDILESCLANGIPLLPKSLVGSIPLYFAK
jgi:signal transduction histidine kinase